MDLESIKRHEKKGLKLSTNMSDLGLKCSTWVSSPPQTLSHNGPSCTNQLKPQLQLQHPQPPLHHPQTHPLQHPQSHGTMMASSCSLAAQQVLSSSQSGSVITQAPSMLTHSGWVRSYKRSKRHPTVHTLFIAHTHTHVLFLLTLSCLTRSSSPLLGPRPSGFWTQYNSFRLAQTAVSPPCIIYHCTNELRESRRRNLTSVYWENKVVAKETHNTHSDPPPPTLPPKHGLCYVCSDSEPDGSLSGPCSFHGSLVISRLD